MRTLAEIKEFAATLPNLPINWEISETLSDSRIAQLYRNTLADRDAMEETFQTFETKDMLQGLDDVAEEMAYELSVQLIEVYATLNVFERLIAIRAFLKTV